MESKALHIPISRRLKPLLLAGIAALILVQVVALTPTTVEQPGDNSTPIAPELLVPPTEPTLANGVPVDQVPDYSVDGFNYVSTHGGVKEWNILANRAFLYNHNRLVHARTVRALLYDPDGKITVVTGQEAKYLMNGRDLEVYGNVVTTFPDGFELHSEYLHYRPNERIVDIPTTQDVRGHGKQEGGKIFDFKSRGLTYAMGKSEIVLESNVEVVMDKKIPEAQDDPKHVGSKTVIHSDHCVIDRVKQLAHFTMFPSRPLDTRFVIITQPTLYSKGRSADLNYGDFTEMLHYIVLYDDVVLIEKSADETEPDTDMRYGTGGRADFDAKSDIVVLSQFPQVYQGKDTVTGDTILLHRDTDIVEVEHSNAFSGGSNEQQPAN
jgi:LPS export ABC transporter protein LptC